MTSREAAVRPQFTRIRKLPCNVTLSIQLVFTIGVVMYGILVSDVALTKGVGAGGGADGDILEQWRRRRKVEEMRSRVSCGETASKSASQIVMNLKAFNLSE